MCYHVSTIPYISNVDTTKQFPWQLVFQSAEKKPHCVIESFRNNILDFWCSFGDSFVFMMVVEIAV